MNINFLSKKAVAEARLDRETVLRCCLIGEEAGPGGGQRLGTGAMKSGDGFWGQGSINNHVNQGLRGD
jgi:hypothetical protein